MVDENIRSTIWKFERDIKRLLKHPRAVPSQRLPDIEKNHFLPLCMTQTCICNKFISNIK